MKESTKRALRTLYQALLALLVVVPAVVAIVPQFDLPATWIAWAVGSSAVIATVSRVVNGLEDAGMIPAWLKSETVAPPVVDPIVVPEPELVVAPEPEAPVEPAVPVEPVASVVEPVEPVVEAIEPVVESVEETVDDAEGVEFSDIRANDEGSI